MVRRSADPAFALVGRLGALWLLPSGHHESSWSVGHQK